MSNTKRAVRIVMVDDDRDDLFLTEICFRQSNFPTEFVALESAEALFSYIKDNGIGSIDVLLLDLNMPVTNGLETLEVLKSYPHYSELNVFMFSTSTHTEDKVESLKSGAKGYINKPSSLKQMKLFVEEISECLEAKKLSMAS
jgi:DNA-binding response OmpR family regulator